MRACGICPVTGKDETIVFDAHSVRNLTDSDQNVYVKGLLDSCSAKRRYEELCDHCPIYDQIPKNFHK